MNVCLRKKRLQMTVCAELKIAMGSFQACEVGDVQPSQVSSRPVDCSQIEDAVGSGCRRRVPPA